MKYNFLGFEKNQKKFEHRTIDINIYQGLSLIYLVGNADGGVLPPSKLENNLKYIKGYHYKYSPLKVILVFLKDDVFVRGIFVMISPGCKVFVVSTPDTGGKYGCNVVTIPMVLGR